MVCAAAPGSQAVVAPPCMDMLVRMSIHAPVHMSMRMRTHMPIHMSIHTHMHVRTRMSIHMRMHMCTHLSIPCPYTCPYTGCVRSGGTAAMSELGHELLGRLDLGHLHSYGLYRYGPV